LIFFCAKRSERLISKLQNVNGNCKRTQDSRIKRAVRKESGTRQWCGFQPSRIQGIDYNRADYKAPITTEQRHGLQIRASDVLLIPVRARRSQIRASGIIFIPLRVRQSQIRAGENYHFNIAVKFLNLLL
jgi:hypothetical protein